MQKTQPWLWSKWAFQVEVSFGVDAEFIATMQAKITKWNFSVCLCSVPLNQVVSLLVQLYSYFAALRGTDRHNGHRDPATLPPRDTMLSKGTRIQSSSNCLCLPTIFATMLHFTKNQTLLRQCIGLGLVRVEQRRQDLITMQVKMTFPERWQQLQVHTDTELEIFAHMQGKLTILPLAFGLKAGKGPEMSSTTSLNKSTATLPGVG